MRAASPVFPAIFRLPASPHHEPQGTQATAHIHNSAPPAREACRANAATQHTANATCSDGTRLWSRFSASANRKRPAQMPRSLDGAKAACDGLTRKPMPPMSVASARMSAENSRRSRTMNGPAKKGESTVRFLQNLPERNGFWERRCEFRGLRRGGDGAAETAGRWREGLAPFAGRRERRERVSVGFLRGASALLKASGPSATPRSGPRPRTSDDTSPWPRRAPAPSVRRSGTGAGC